MRRGVAYYLPMPAPLAIWRQLFAMPHRDQPYGHSPYGLETFAVMPPEDIAREELPRGTSRTGFAESRFCLFGQLLEWPYGDFDDRLVVGNVRESDQRCRVRQLFASRARGCSLRRCVSMVTSRPN
jgi:hypothetical protein